MGTHPIFESDFDCLTECRKNSLKRRQRKSELKSEELEFWDAVQPVRRRFPAIESLPDLISRNLEVLALETKSSKSKLKKSWQIQLAMELRGISQHLRIQWVPPKQELPHEKALSRVLKIGALGAYFIYSMFEYLLLHGFSVGLIHLVAAKMNGIEAVYNDPAESILQNPAEKFRETVETAEEDYSHDPTDF